MVKNVSAWVGFACLLATGCGAASDGDGSGEGTSSDAVTAEDNGPRVCADGAMVVGVDLAHYAGAVNWSTLASEGVTFGAAKATQGNNIRDPNFATYWAGMKSAGVIRGAYHFFIDSLDGTQQADLYLQTVDALPGTSDLLPILDLEDTSGIGTSAKAAASVKQIQKFVAEIKAKTGLPTILFMAPSYWLSLGSPASLTSDSILWISNTGATCPNLPSPWPRWSLWQYASNQTIAGASGDVDLNVFNGSIDELRAFAGIRASAPPVTVGGGNSGTGGGGGTTGTSTCTPPGAEASTPNGEDCCHGYEGFNSSTRTCG